MDKRDSNYLFCTFNAFWLVWIFLFVGCNRKEQTLFEKIVPAASGISFSNNIADTDSLNILDYLYYYNGAGVSVGDINNDSLPDIYFVSNQAGNQLYLNKGNWIFEDITSKAGVAAPGGWKTGSTMVDINGDNLLDIFVSVVTENLRTDTLPGAGKSREVTNRLYINQGDMTFREEAAKWGLDLQGYNTQSVFFDMDKDGDLDCFQLQHSIHQTDVYGDTALRRKYNAVSGGKLLKNEGEHFTDITRTSGIISSALGYGLGVAVADFNNDGWEDIYVGNDFHENDYYYVNQGNGSFVESSSSAFGHVSNFSMGNDAADINNDGWIDLVTLDMLPSDEKILKSSAGDKPLDLYESQHALGYHYQNARNCLQLNTAQGERFSEIGLYSGIAATDWSWSALVADYDLDGVNDIFITNGIKQRLNDLDYIKFLSSEKNTGLNQHSRSRDKELLSRQPDGKWHNYLFKGSDSLVFADKSVEWGMGEMNLSNGAAYADLDRDGDLDLVTNNLNAPAGIYRNNTRESGQGNFLSIMLQGSSANKFGIGSKVFVFAGGRIFHQQLQPSRGFLSSSPVEMIVGLGEHTRIDSVVVIWPGNTFQVVRDITANSKIVLPDKNAEAIAGTTAELIRTILQVAEKSQFTDITGASTIDFRHRENDFDDFNRQWFIPHKLSTSGPAMDVADINADGLDDIFLGGGKNQPAAIYLQQANGSFTRTVQPALHTDSASEDVDAVFFDADNDKDADLYVVSGGNEMPVSSVHMQDRLYINDGKGLFSKKTSLPDMRFNKSAVSAADYDQDGDTDLFVCSRSDVFSYGIVPPSYLLQNDGRGNFTDVTKTVLGNDGKLGMLTDASWVDLDNDTDPDLVIVGEWMAPVILINDKGRLTVQSNTGMEQASGWWQTVETGDINGDGKADIIAGNYGLNSKLTPAKDYPVTMHLIDPDKNKSTDQLLVLAKNEKYYPFLGKEDLERQLPFLKKEYLSYGNMAGKTSDEIFKASIASGEIKKAATFASTIFYNTGGNKFVSHALPYPLQWAPVFSIALNDFDGDGRTDIFSAGNFSGVMPYEGRYDALLPAVAYQKARGSFTIPLPVEKSLNIPGEFRKCRIIRLPGNRKALLLARNNNTPLLLEYSPPNSKADVPGRTE